MSYVIKHLGVAAKFVKLYLLIEELKELHVHINLYNKLKNSLIIHEENRKKNHKRVVSVYVIQIHVDLHKLKL
jgi:hypothetical protein